MYRKLFVVALFLVSYAHAGEKQCKPPVKPPVTKPPVSTPKPTPSPIASASGTAVASSSSAATVTASQAQNQNQNQSTNVSSDGNAQNVTSNSVYKEVRQTPFAFSPTIIPTDCQRTLTGGASSPFAALSIGGSRRDHECEALRLVRVFIELGNFTAAAKVICSTDSSKRAKLTIEDCQAIIPPVRVVKDPQVEFGSTYRDPSNFDPSQAIPIDAYRPPPPPIIIPPPAITINMPPVSAVPVDPIVATPKRIVEADPVRKKRIGAKKAIALPACPLPMK